MATRFYLPSAGGPAISPPFAAAWNVTSSAVRLATATSKSGTAAASIAADGGTPGVVNVLFAQYVSSALSAQTISGTIKGQIRAREADLGIDARAQLVVRVIGPGDVIRGTLVAAQAEVLSSEFSTALVNRKFPLAALLPFTVTNVNAQAGDFLVLEIGALVGNGAIDEITLLVGDVAVADLAEDETSTAANNPWIEFSANISFQTPSSSFVPLDSLDIGINPLTL